MARPCLRCQAPSSRGRQNGTAAVDPPCTCRFINGTTRHRGSFSSALPLGSLRGAWFFLVATARRSMGADSGSFAKALCQDSCQYVNYCLRALSCAFTKSLAVRLSSHASPLLLCVNFSQLRQNHCRAEGTACSRVKWSAHLAGNVAPPPSLRVFLPHSE